MPTLKCTNCKKLRDVLSNGVCNPCLNFRAHFDQLVRDDLIEWLQQSSDKVYVKLTDDEIKTMQAGSLIGVGFRLQKIILCALAGYIEGQFASESSMRHVRMTKKIDQARI